MAGEYFPSVEVMDDAARRLDAPSHQSYLAMATEPMKEAFKVICTLIGRHEPPEGSPEAETPIDSGFEIPAKLSAFPGMDGFRADFPSIAARLDITVDGEPVTNVLAYDVEAGTVTRFKHAADGHVSLKRARDPANHDIVSGEIEIIDRG